MEKKKICEGGSDPTSLLLGSNSIACINRKKVTFTDGCSSCGSKKRRCQVTEEEPRKKINLVDPNSTFRTSNVTVKSTMVSPQKPSDNNFSFHWPPPFRQSDSSCGLNSPEAIKTTGNNPPQQQVLDRTGSFSDTSPDILKSTLAFIKPARTCPPFVLDPVAVPISSTISPKSNETITTVTKHPFSSSPSGEIIGGSSAKTESTLEDIHPQASKKSNCVRVLWSKEEKADQVQDACNNDSKKKTVVVVSKARDQESPTSVQFKCDCGRFCEIFVFH